MDLGYFTIFSIKEYNNYMLKGQMPDVTKRLLYEYIVECVKSPIWEN